MEARGDTPRTWADAGDLAGLVSGPGPFLTIVLATESKIENASQTNQTRWRSQRDDLAAAGAPEAALAAIDDLVPDAHQHGETLVAIASEQGLAHVSHWPGLPRREIARWSPLPELGPVLDLRQSHPAYVVAVADRRGADVIAIDRAKVRDEASVDGETYRARKVQAGGWSQRRFQEHAEGVWEDNAEQAAGVVTRLAENVEAELVAVSGDVRAVQFLTEALPKEVAAKVQVLDGSRSIDGAPPVEDTQLDAALAAVVAHDEEALLQKVAEESGQHDRAAQGVHLTVAALIRSQVEVLLVHDDPDDTRTAFFGPEPNAVASARADLQALGITDIQEGRLVDVLIRGALGTGAGVHVLTDASRVAEGVGAILRWA